MSGSTSTKDLTNYTASGAAGGSFGNGPLLPGYSYDGQGNYLKADGGAATPWEAIDPASAEGKAYWTGLQYGAEPPKGAAPIDPATYMGVYHQLTANSSEYGGGVQIPFGVTGTKFNATPDNPLFTVGSNGYATFTPQGQQEFRNYYQDQLRQVYANAAKNRGGISGYLSTPMGGLSTLALPLAIGGGAALLGAGAAGAGGAGAGAAAGAADAAGAGAAGGDLFLGGTTAEGAGAGAIGGDAALGAGGAGTAGTGAVGGGFGLGGGSSGGGFLGLGGHGFIADSLGGGSGLLGGASVPLKVAGMATSGISGLASALGGGRPNAAQSPPLTSLPTGPGSWSNSVVPLSSLAAMMPQNALALQQQNPSMPWYRVPGMLG